MPTLRSSIIAGPARITQGGHTFFSKGDIKVDLTIKTFDVETSGQETQKRVDQSMAVLTFTPNGVFGPMAAVLRSYAGYRIGQDVFGDEDAPLVIESNDGQQYTYAASAFTKLPDLMLSAVKTLWGPATITCITADGTAPSGANSIVAINANHAYPDPDGYDPDAIITQPYLLSYGGDPWANLETESGVNVSFGLSLEEKKNDSLGVIGMRVKGRDVTAKATPLGVTSADVLAAMKVQGDGAARGRRIGAGGTNLVVTGTDVYFMIYSAGITASATQFGSNANRVGEISWVANQTQGGSSLYYIDVAD